MPLPPDVYSPDNLGRAWRWLKSNPDAAYKGYFRSLYGVYDSAAPELLEDLRDRLRRGLFEPTASCKLLLPKSSGILRPYTLLTVEDQIVYQAAMNIVAERLFPRVRHRYNREVFGHLYAGRNSSRFYRKWSSGYSRFNRAARKAFADGYQFAATFDLTAFYDSLDHGVLRHFLAGIGCTADLTGSLIGWLSVWTATDRGIFHAHGIPQGPLSSGLLAEVVLQHFDEYRRFEGRVRYLRYVDDIRLFAKSERALREMLVHLDRLKDVGLFPQVSKIGIRKVIDIEQELKSISNPGEAVVKTKSVNQPRLRRRLIQLSRRHRIVSPTRFKYLLAHASPQSKLTTRLWRIHENHLDFYQPFARYLQKYQTMPHAVAIRLRREIRTQTLYPAVRAAMLEVALDRLSPAEARELDGVVKRIWAPRTLPPDVFARAGVWAIRRSLLTIRQLEYALGRERPWWSRTQLILSMDSAVLAKNSLSSLLNAALRDSTADVSMAAAASLLRETVAVGRPLTGMSRTVGVWLRAVGLLRRRPPGASGIEVSLQRMLGRTHTIAWRALFGGDYRSVEAHMVFARGLMQTNPTAWVNAMDVFSDWLLVALARRDPALGGYQTGNLGGFLHNRHLRTDWLATQAMVESLHQKRLESTLSHARVRRSGKPTRIIGYRYVSTARRLIGRALDELALKI